MKKNLYKFAWYMSHCQMEGTFLATPQDVKRVIGKRVDFGEVNGKHSEVYGEIENGEIKLVTEDQEFIKKYKELGLCSGYDPIARYLCEQVENYENEDLRDWYNNYFGQQEQAA